MSSSAEIILDSSVVDPPSKKRKLALTATSNDEEQQRASNETTTQTEAAEAAPVYSSANSSAKQTIMAHSNNNNNGSTGPNNEAPNHEIDESLYSRQLYVLGHEAMRRMQASNVLISGLGGLGVEIAKNVILGGVKSVTLHDTAICSIADLSSQYYLSEAAVGRNRAEACCQALSDLNSYVPTRTYSGELTEAYLKKFRCVVLAGVNYAEQLRVSKICHDNDIALIIGDTRGLFGQVFCDFGERFVVFDKDGASPLSTIVASVSHDSQGVVTCLEETRHGFEDGDYVTFSEVEGMTELNGCDPIKVTVLGPYTFSIGDTSNYSAYIRGGIVKQVKMPFTMSFKSFPETQESDVGGNVVDFDYSKLDHPYKMHVAFKALHQYMSRRNRAPRPWNREDADAFLKIVDEIRGDVELDEKYFKLFSYICSGDVCSFNAAIGGIIAQEVMKACTGKFTPIKQYYYFDAIECLPDGELAEEDCQPLGCRYDSQIAVFGKQFQEKLGALKYFIVGAGAIGCELLKNFAMAGIGCTTGEIIVTDMDSIEKSNLNRQFLFRSSDVQKLKATTAAQAVKRMNGQINIVAHENRVGAETESIYNDEFFERLDGVANALDNMEARTYMDRRCVYYRKPLIDSGTLGTMGNIQVVVPHLTESYSSTQDPPEKNIPICTLKNFPNAIEHTLQWARDMFEYVFKQVGENAFQFKSDPQFIDRIVKLPGVQPLEILDSVKSALIDERPKSMLDCVKWARLLWQKNFSDQIQQLLHNFPADQLTSTGQPFWSGPKRCPTPLFFDADDDLHLDFVFAGANLRAELYGLPQNRNREEIREMVRPIVVPSFKPSSVRIAVTDAEIQQDNNSDNLDQERVSKIITDLANMGAELQRIKVAPIDFEKDDDNNLHMDFIVAASNLRATNYKIQLANRYESKLIAGKIIPAIATTTSVVAGLATLEIYKLLQGHNTLEKFKSYFVNLALPLFTCSEPMAAKKLTYYEIDWTLWDRFEVQGEMTLAEFIQYFEREHRLKITMLSQSICMLYSFFLNKEKKAERMNMPMSEVVRLVSKKKIEPHVRALIFEICCNDEEGEDIEVPYVRYTLP